MRKSIVILVYIYVFLFCLGCGTRKASTDISKSETKDIAKEESKGATSKENKQIIESDTNEQLSKSDEKQESRVTELFFENGMLKERITELINSKSLDNSKRSENNTILMHTRTDSVFNNTIYRDRTITIKEKSKAVTTDRNGLYWFLGVVSVICLAFWLKPWK